MTHAFISINDVADKAPTISCLLVALLLGHVTYIHIYPLVWESIRNVVSFNTKQTNENNEQNYQINRKKNYEQLDPLQH